MSLYCKGNGCDKSASCLRKARWDEFPDKTTAIGFDSGLWLVDESDCISKNYSDGVFI